MLNYPGGVMSLKQGEKHGEDGEGAHVNERPDCPDAPGSPTNGRRMRGNLPSTTTKLVAETIIDAYEQTHYYGRAREYSLQAHHWKHSRKMFLS